MLCAPTSGAVAKWSHLGSAAGEVGWVEERGGWMRRWVWGQLRRISSDWSCGQSCRRVEGRGWPGDGEWSQRFQQLSLGWFPYLAPGARGYVGKAPPLEPSRTAAALTLPLHLAGTVSGDYGQTGLLDLAGAAGPSGLARSGAGRGGGEGSPGAEHRSAAGPQPRRDGAWTAKPVGPRAGSRAAPGRERGSAADEPDGSQEPHHARVWPHVRGAHPRPGVWGRHRPGGRGPDAGFYLITDFHSHPGHPRGRIYDHGWQGKAGRRWAVRTPVHASHMAATAGFGSPWPPC